MKYKFISPVRFFFYLAFAFLSAQEVLANSSCVFYLSADVDEVTSVIEDTSFKAPLLANSKTDFIKDNNYRLEQKVYTFPDISDEAITFIEYTKELSGLRQTDQCSEGCSFNSVSSYIEAFIAHFKNGRLSSNDEISANYMHAMYMFIQFRYALLDLDQTLTIGGSIEWNLIEFLNKGVYLEEDFRSLNTVDIEGIRQQLNRRLQNIKQKDPHGLNIDLDQESLFAFKILNQGFGVSILGPSIYSGAEFLKDKNINSISYASGGKILESVTLGGASSFVDLNEKAIQSLAKSTIRSMINKGLPLLLSYRHSSSYINPETGVFTYDPAIEPNVGHAALIVGYRLDVNGEIDMVKIQNSHANAPVFHMTIDSLHALANSIIYLTP